MPTDIQTIFPTQPKFPLDQNSIVIPIRAGIAFFVPHKVLSLRLQKSLCNILTLRLDSISVAQDYY
jgi:hypothetical protein